MEVIARPVSTSGNARLAAHTSGRAAPSLASSLQFGSCVSNSRALSASAAQQHRDSRSEPRTRRLGVRADTLATASGDEAFAPAAPFYKVEAVLRPWRIEFVCRALLDQGIRGVTVSDARGFGAQGGSRERQAGSEFFGSSLIPKAKLEVVVVADQVEAVVDTIIAEARTGEIGDGKIFVSPVAEVIRIRTGERGVEAERMAGGRQDILRGKSHLYASIDGKEIL